MGTYCVFRSHSATSPTWSSSMIPPSGVVFNASSILRVNLGEVVGSTPAVGLSFLYLQLRTFFPLPSWQSTDEARASNGEQKFRDAKVKREA